MADGGTHCLGENGTASRRVGKLYRELAGHLGESYPFVTIQILKPLVERFTGQADAEGARC